MKNIFPSQSEPVTRARVSVIRTEDGTVIAFDPASGLSVSRLSVDEALAELARLIAARRPALIEEGEAA